MRIPGVGRELMQRFGVYAHLATWAMVVRAAAEGTVSATWDGRDRVRWSPGPLDMERAVPGRRAPGANDVRGGAREVWTGLYGVLGALRSADEVRLVDAMPRATRGRSAFISSHPFGAAARMGRDLRSTVVGTDFQS